MFQPIFVSVFVADNIHNTVCSYPVLWLLITIKQ